MSFRSENQSGLCRGLDNDGGGAEETSLPALICVKSVTGVAGDAEERGIGNLFTKAEEERERLKLSNDLGGNDVEIRVAL